MEQENMRNFDENIEQEDMGHVDKNMKTISIEEANSIILSGETLYNAKIEKIVFNNTSVPKITLENCEIGEFILTGCICLDSINIKNCTIGETILSNNDYKNVISKTIYKQHVRILNTVFLEKFICVQAEFQGEYSCTATFKKECLVRLTHFKKDIALTACVYEDNLKITSCVFHGNAWMRKTISKGIFSFSKLDFKEKLTLTNSNFGNTVIINLCTFMQRCGLNKVICTEKIEFLTCSFFGEFSSQGSNFHNNFAMHKSLIAGIVLLANTTFHKKKILKNCQIKNNINTKDTIYNGVVSLDHINSEGSFNFNNTTFNQEFLCRDSYFGGDDSQLNFENTTFKRTFDLERTQLNVSLINFKGAKFQKVQFNMTKWGTQNGLVEFLNCNFQHHLNLENASFQGQVNFTGSTFKQHAKFNKITFYQNAFFDNCTFQEKSSFEGSQFLKQSHFTKCEFQEVSFINTEFEGISRFSTESSMPKCPENQNAAIFKSVANFANARFNKKVLFQKVQFFKDALFNNVYFGEQISFRNAIFKENAVFRGTFCSLELDLRKIQVEKEVTLKGANINRRLNLADASFSKISFYNMVTDVIAISPENIEGKLREDFHPDNPIDLNRTAQEYLALKKSFSMQGMHEEEDWAYWKFRRSQRCYRSLQAKKDGKIFPQIKNFFERIFIDYGSNYGTHPFRITFLAGLFILGFGVFYWMFPEQLVLEGNEIKPGQVASFAQSIYFSVMAFTTMGFGDIHPNFNGWLKGIVAFEALVGIITMTLFVGTYARKIVR